MRYELQTIPIWDAYETQAQCVLCQLADRLEAQYVRFHLGNSVMAPDTRVMVNRHGFCSRHLALLLEGGNKHGFSLMLQTHLETIRGGLLRELRSLAGSTSGKVRAKLKKRLAGVADRARKQYGSCLICDKMDHMLRNYAYSILYLFRTEDRFRELFQSSSGFCFEHLPLVLETSRDALGGRDLGTWLSALAEAQHASVRETESELGEFADVFDYRSSATLSDYAKKAPDRAAALLGGRRTNASPSNSDES